MLDQFMPYEGAGFLPCHKGRFVLGIRVKKPEDVAKDATVEIEYMGGKPEPEDGNDPMMTAHNEFVEEVGAQVLDADWRARLLTPVNTFQPFTKKWIRCWILELTDAEYARLAKLDAVHDQWKPDETRDLSAITKRPEPARKSVSAFVAVRGQDLADYVSNFAKVPASKNRMGDAKAYRLSAKPISTTRLADGAPAGEFPLRAFNTVIFEEHASLIARTVGYQC